MDPVTETLLSLPLPSAFYVLFAASARALGLLTGLWGLYFVLGPAMILRMGLAVTLSLPLIVAAAADLSPILLESGPVRAAILPIREFALGFVLGLMASLPFITIMGAGVVVDQYRGDFNPVLDAPESAQVGSYAKLKVVIALFVFVEIGGFLTVLAALYQSYAMIPPGPFGTFDGLASARFLGKTLQDLVWVMVLLALPALILLFLIDAAVALAARLSSKIKLDSMDFLLKSLAFLVVMPVFVVALVRVIETTLLEADLPLTLLLRAIGP